MEQIKRTILFLLLCLFILPTYIYAEEAIDVSLDYGIDGKVQIGKGFPMKVTLLNEGEHFSGDLVIFSTPNYEAAGNLVLPVELPAGEERTYEISIPGHDDIYYGPQQNNESHIRLYEGEWEDGKEVEISGDTEYRPSMLPENRLIMGALTNSYDAINFLNLVRYNGESIEFNSISEDELANDSMGLEIFDVLLINDYNVSNLPTEKQEAIAEWVRAGGHLIIGSNSVINEQLGELHELSLMTVDEETTLQSISIFEPDDEEEGLPDFSKTSFYTGEIRPEANIIYSEQSVPLVINQNISSGEVTQFTFNIGSETLTSWDPYTSWWTEALQKTVDKDPYGPQRFVREDLSFRLGNVVESFPSSFIPVKTLIIVFIIYLIVLIPGLYFLLKKIDKRELSWIIIPVIAIVSSIAVFVIGAKDRIAGSQVNDVSILSIDEQGNANGIGAFSLLTSNGGDYAVTVQPKEFQPFPRYRRHSGTPELMFNYAMIEKGQNQSTITFNDVEYWSIRSALGDINGVESGRLVTDLKIENEQLIGTITNSLEVSLEETYLLTGNEAFSLGEMHSGETIEVEQELDNSNIQNWLGAPRQNIASKVINGFSNPYYGRQTTNPIDKDNLTEWKKFELLDTAMNYENQKQNLNQPLIIGFTSESIVEINANKNVSDRNSLSLITQAVEISTGKIQGSFSLSSDVFIPDIKVANQGQGFIMYNGLHNGEDFIAIEEGIYDVTYELPLPFDIESTYIESLRVTHSRGNGVEFSIYNVQTEAYESLAEGKSFTNFEDNASHYIAEDGTITIQMNKTTMNGNPEVRVPTLKLEGEYNDDRNN